MREMKDSGIEWIGEIPAKWTRKKLSYLSERIGDGLHGTPVFDSDGCYYFINGNNIGKKEIQIKNNTDTVNFDEYRKYMQPLNNNTILISLNGTIGCVSDYNNEKIILGKSAGYIALFPLINREFIRYYLQSDASQIAFVLSFSGTTINNLSLATLRNLSVLLPDNDEQNRIVSFLDNKCAEIDNLVSDLQSQIEVLEEYKRSVITEAVTKGLDPDVEMRDSGIAWVGDIPAHWLVEKVKFHLQRYEPRNPGDKQVLSVYREYGVIPKDSRDDNHNVTSEDTSNYKYVVPGCLVINKMKAWQGSMGVSEYEGIVSPAYFIYKFTDNQIMPKYLHYLFRSCYKDEFRRISGGIREGQWDLSPYEFSNTLLLIPPIDEQNGIVSYIDARISEIESAITEKKQQIETIEEYKKSLIFEYVTGKKEVQA